MNTVYLSWGVPKNALILSANGKALTSQRGLDNLVPRSSDLHVLNFDVKKQKNF